MLGKVFNKILAEDEDTEEKRVLHPGKSDIDDRSFWQKHGNLVIAIALFVIALLPRLIFLFAVSDPQNAGDGWYGDTYHHWQIAYLSREIGFHKSFLRLWDLKGMEYFWGPLHPLLMMLMFSITGSVSIVNARLLSILFGSGVIALLYMVIAEFWNRKTALATALFAITLPVAILNDSSGMLEPIGLFLLLLGILLLSKNVFLSGMSWALAAMARAEAWLFGVLLLVLSPRVLKRPGQLAILTIGWLVPMLLYMKYLLDSTKNLIYPIWWNYLANVKGVWATSVGYTPYQLSVKPFLVAWFIISLLALVGVFFKYKARGSIFILFGLANWAFIGGFMGLTHYLTGFQPWFWVIRFFEFPYVFAGFLVALLVLYIVPKRAPILNKLHLVWTLWIPVVFMLLAVQLIFWPPILEKYNSTRSGWQITKTWAHEFGQQYQGGKVLISEAEPNFTYAIVYFEHIQGKNIVGQMFDPFYYMPDDPFVDWEENRLTMLGWLKKEDIRLIMVDVEKGNYTKMINLEPGYFEYVGDIAKNKYLIYKVYPERINLE